MNKYIVYFENEVGDILTIDVMANNLREAVILGSNSIGCKIETTFIPIKVGMVEVDDTVNFIDLRSTYDKKVSRSSQAC